MAAAYDSYNYPAYWLNREYEHKSEFLAIKTLLLEIPKLNLILEVGAGFGRLLPSYSFRARKITLSDPSAKLLSIARQTYSGNKKLDFIQSSLENLSDKVKRRKFDLIIMVRVLHHLENSDDAIKMLSKLLNNNGYLILEFANKSHLKAIFSEFFKGNLTFPLDISPKDISSKKSKKTINLPFVNYHPDAILHRLKLSGFKIINKLSVSNIRSSFIKKHISLETLLWLEKHLQKPFSFFSFGPSIFILAQKT